MKQLYKVFDNNHKKINFQETKMKTGEISREIGVKIKNYRKLRGMTQEELAVRIYKSKATLSKYEKGEIIVDIETLYAIAESLQIRVDHLLYHAPQPETSLPNPECPSFFQPDTQFFSYVYDGRKNNIMHCVYDILEQTEYNRYRLEMFMNFKNFEDYMNCETSYWGCIEHYDAVTNILLTNQKSPMEKASAQILAPYLDSETKWGLFKGFSSRPMMPVATKMLFSKKLLKEDETLTEQLKITKEDIRLFKLYNMYPVM